MIALYSDALSPHCSRVLCLLHEASIAHEIRPVDMMKGEYLTPEYQAINPNRQVPSMLDGTLRIHESNAILRYLCRKHGLEQWYPQDLPTLARVEQWLDWNQCRLAPQMTTLVMNRMFLGDQADLAAAGRAETELQTLFALLAEGLRNSAFIAADHPTIADLSLVSNLILLDFANVRSDNPLIQRWYDRVTALRGFRQLQT
jgi:glutathione S-transferase